MKHFPPEPPTRISRECALAWLIVTAFVFWLLVGYWLST
jgi:hypothetical protein